MSSSLYEIIDLGNGEFGLRRAGEEGEPLVRIKFSSEAEYYLGDARLEVAKSMIEAGLETVGELLEESEEVRGLQAEIRTLH